MIKFPSLFDTVRESRLTPPTAPVRMVLDTDTFNEVDDQFAVCQAILAPERLELEALYAAPFHNQRSSGPADGMEKSFEEIHRLLNMLNVKRDNFVFRGSDRYLIADDKPVSSDAVTDLVRRAMAPNERPLYVAAIGAITNVASALLMEPRLVEKIIVVWLGGHDHGQLDTREFNLKQDPTAARVILESGVPFIQIPCLNVASHLITTVAELTQYLKGKNEIGTYLTDIVAGYAGHSDPYAWSKVIWDISVTSWLINPDWIPTRVVPTPTLREDITWGPPPSGRHAMRVALRVQRNPVFRDVFQRLVDFNGDKKA